MFSPILRGYIMEVEFTYLGVMKKVQRVYNSCETEEQLEVGKQYVVLLTRKYNEIESEKAKDSIRKFYANQRRIESLVKHCKFLREKRLTEIQKELLCKDVQ